jgi:hypothetical protein
VRLGWSLSCSAVQTSRFTVLWRSVNLESFLLVTNNTDQHFTFPNGDLWIFINGKLALDMCAFALGESDDNVRHYGYMGDQQQRIDVLAIRWPASTQLSFYSARVRNAGSRLRRHAAPNDLCEAPGKAGGLRLALELGEEGPRFFGHPRRALSWIRGRRGVSAIIRTPTDWITRRAAAVVRADVSPRGRPG